jgi:hypothetical protein
MKHYVPAHLARVVFRSPARRVESVPKHLVCILMPVTIHEKLSARHGQRDTHIEKPALLFVTMRLLHAGVTTHHYG